MTGAAAWRRRLPVPGRVKNRWLASSENDHVGRIAARTVRRTPDVPAASGNHHRNELGTHVEAARIPRSGCPHREAGGGARLIPVLGGRETKCDAPRCTGPPASSTICVLATTA